MFFEHIRKVAVYLEFGLFGLDWMSCVPPPELLLVLNLGNKIILGWTLNLGNKIKSGWTLNLGNKIKLGWTLNLGNKIKLG